MDKKTIKVTNKKQMEKLVELMEQNEDVGRGKIAFGSNRIEQQQIWEDFSEVLNSLGPPFRTGKEWQRVWIHYKAKVKQKLANNRKNVLATGGGPSEEIPLNPLEEAVTALVQMTRQVVPEGRPFGIESNVPSSNPSVSDAERQRMDSDIHAPQATPRQRNKRKSAAEEERLEVLRSQCETQQKVLDKITKLGKTVYKQYLLSKEKFEFEKRKEAKEDELRRLKVEYQKKKLAKLEMEY